MLGGFLAIEYFLNWKNAGKLQRLVTEYRTLLLLKHDPSNNTYYRELHRFRARWSNLS
jgi:hypothetical protein